VLGEFSDTGVFASDAIRLSLVNISFIMGIAGSAAMGGIIKRLSRRIEGERIRRM
jgi:hypothetical protein